MKLNGRKKTWQIPLKPGEFWHTQRALYFSAKLKKYLRKVKAGKTGREAESRTWILAFYSAQEGLAALRILARMERLEMRKQESIRKFIANDRKERETEHD